jgi:hypothetical protein
VTSTRGKLLVYYVDPGEAAAMRRRLRAAGVVAEVDSVDPHNIQPSRSGTRRIGLYVTFDDQFDDAVQLLQNPDHVPRRVIGPSEMDDAGSKRALSWPVSTQSRYTNLAIVLAVICLLAAIVYLAVS